MASELLFSVGMVIALAVWLGAKRALAVRRRTRQAQVACFGASSQGTIAAIQRPFLLDSCTRFYFDFTPAGAPEPLRVCHVVHDWLDELSCTPPPIGASVSVRYLPEAPREAVIAVLAPTLTQTKAGREPERSQEPGNSRVRERRSSCGVA
ncbi:MAG TPA: hypothetical protein VK025_11545 [Steroidobacter sp.]|nr:hypothetical protein [Steroidobacter sp.]